jgi:hypothetical protein
LLHILGALRCFRRKLFVLLTGVKINSTGVLSNTPKRMRSDTNQCLYRFSEKADRGDSTALGPWPKPER